MIIIKDWFYQWRGVLLLAFLFRRPNRWSIFWLTTALIIAEMELLMLVHSKLWWERLIKLFSHLIFARTALKDELEIWMS
jgi:hypothetical protein